MVNMYIKIDENNKIIQYHQYWDVNSINVNVDEKLLENAKIFSCSYIDGTIVFSEDDYNKRIMLAEKSKKEIEAQRKLEKMEKERLLITLNDEDALNVMCLYPSWDGAGVLYEKDDRLVYADKFYKVLQNHMSQEDWTPDKAVSLYVEISDPSIEFPEFKKPQGAHDTYMNGDKVTFNGKHYVSVTDYNIYSPEEYPQNWKEID